MATTAPVLWLNGTWQETRTTTIALMGHAPQRGSLVFDVGSFHKTKSGIALFRVQEHVRRFMHSAHIIGLDVPFDEAALVNAAIGVVARQASEHGLVRWSAFFAANEPDLVPRNTATNVAVAAQILEDTPRVAPLRIALFDDARKAPREALPPEAKAAAAYLGPMLARRRALAQGADDVVLLDTFGNVAEAPIANVFAVVDGTVWTPPLGCILPGITRDSVLALARREGLTVREEAMPPHVLASASEAFLTATSFGIAPIGSVNEHPMVEAPGPITKRLMAALRAAQEGTDVRLNDWLAFVR
jgi:branched-chain amino acid aminotransferase